MSDYSWPYRISKAVRAGVLNAALWLAFPLVMTQVLGSALPTTPLPVDESLILSFGIPITALQVLGALTVGMARSVPLLSGSYLAEAFYIWTAAGGGALRFDIQSLGISLLFQPLLFLLVLPSLFWSVRVPLTYLLEQSEAGGAAPDEV